MFIFSTHLHSRGSTKDAILEGLHVEHSGLCNSFFSGGNESIIYWTRNVIIFRKRTACTTILLWFTKEYLIHIFTASHHPPPPPQCRRQIIFTSAFVLSYRSSSSASRPPSWPVPPIPPASGSASVGRTRSRPPRTFWPPTVARADCVTALRWRLGLRGLR